MNNVITYIILGAIESKNPLQSPSKMPRNSPQILLFSSIERQIALGKANQTENWSYFEVQAVIQNPFSCLSSVI